MIRGGPTDPGLVPVLPPDTMRRTTSMVISSPDGFTAPLHLRATAVDQYRSGAGSVMTLREAGLTALLDRWTCRVATLAVQPTHALTDELVGLSARHGFRAELRRVVAGLPEGDLRVQLLDDMPGSTIVGDYPSLREGVNLPSETTSSDRHLAMTDVCAGWSSQGEAITAVRMRGGGPLLPPHAPVVGSAQRGVGAVSYSAMPPSSTRRLRILDVSVLDSGEFQLNSMFRDSFTILEDDGLEERALHEYTVRAVLDRTGDRFTESAATAHVLPWYECPGAVASAGRLVGRRPSELRKLISLTFNGTSTCTHLNDTLRSLADSSVLARELLVLASAAGSLGESPR